MKQLFFVSIIAITLTACGDGANTGNPNSGVIPVKVEWDSQGHLVKDTEVLPMTGQWCQELDHSLRRIGSPSNCVADY